FSLMGIPLLAGRAFTADDRGGAPLVVILSAAAVKRDWPNESPLGQNVKFQGELRTVVGIVADIKDAKLAAAEEPTIYSPFDQRQTGAGLLVRTRGEPAAMISAIRAALHDVAPAAVVTSIDVMDDLVRRSFAEERFRTLLIGLFGVIAGVLAAVGM